MTARPIRRLREVLVHANRFVRIHDDEVAFPDGSLGRYVRVTPAVEGVGVVLLAVCGGAVALVHTYRYPLGSWQWALPRGFAQDTDPLVTARAELREELGVTAVDLSVLGTFTPDSGLLSTRVSVVRATLADREVRPEDTNEVAAVRWIPAADLWTMAADGTLDDGMTLAAMSLALASGALPAPNARRGPAAANEG
ncbi:NUDIX hydrolase [Streptomyces sp. SL13]|uniref:NUDIX hydrolase n=1 Tax=Streptantibioticus silvisoli TaxID=2705255 RepID=A0AA90H6M6_9ACTN|nr:NUDIX hydrolase [Streptantibioticus silvisoli]MDI5971432.1 NUDIX hydrolase [Streptantibioticus silvisoli]